eukprot:CAMPEP_0198145406 /NCGR_PEP_ID=MMETSP1443-20131203/23259_1 /TAXON_ID=186043 /ORGANISM="Entomoneis sp., Strain CCMP2396" /LENGTH=282 /DNA_ID=CAMNT_0043809047 /DNA_START=254 /DNA_END=1102 /DNA_ORIENTATION=-
MAISRELPNSFGGALSQHFEESSADNGDVQQFLDMEKARQQHKTYISELRKVVPTLVLPALEDFPDCSFVEDTVVAIGNRALITNPGHESRRGEVDSIREVLEQLGMEVVDMRTIGKNKNKIFSAHCDGGDVMYTGRHLFVGLSDRTNYEGIKMIEQVFPDVPLIPVLPVAQGKQVLHLKSAVTHLNETTLLAPSDPIGHKVLRAMRANELGYEAIRVPDILACNAVVVDGTVLVQDTKCETTRQALQSITEKLNLELRFVDTSELAKKDAALTCCSVLLSL